VLPRTVGESGSEALKPFEKLPLASRTLSLIRRHDALANAAADQLVADLKLTARRGGGR
jgi:hypothetical protein